MAKKFGRNVPNDRDDLFQLAWLAAYDAAVHYIPNETSSYFTYAFVVIRGAMLNHHRQQRQRKMGAIINDELWDGERKFDGQFEWQEVAKMVSNLVRRSLPNKSHRNIFWSYYYEEVPTEIIAKSYGISTTRVRQLNHRSMKTIRERIDNEIMLFLEDSNKNYFSPSNSFLYNDGETSQENAIRLMEDSV
jgi:RNA polymerase sigma factor (sigma-70 family)